MSFRVQPNRHGLVRARSSRARCRKCKGALAKDEVVVAIDVFVRPQRRQRMFRCLACCRGQAAFANVPWWVVPTEAERAKAHDVGRRGQAIDCAD